MGESRSASEDPDLVIAAAQTAIEQVIWKQGIVGEPCARVARLIVDALTDAGLVISRKAD